MISSQLLKALALQTKMKSWNSLINKYFTNIGSSLNSKLPKTGEDPIQHIKHNTASCLCAPTDPTEIINIVKSGTSSKSSGVDNIDLYVVQKIIPQMANQLAHVFNKSLQTGMCSR